MFLIAIHTSIEEGRPAAHPAQLSAVLCDQYVQAPSSGWVTITIS